MRSFTRIILLSFLFTSQPFAANPPAAAGFFQDMYGVVTDPLKLKATSSKISDSAERILLQLEALRGRTDYDIQQRLEQLRSILQDVIDGTDKVISNAITKISALEQDIYADAIRLIYRAQCAAVDVMDQFHRSFAQMVAEIRKANPGINIAGIRIANVKLNEVVIENPDQAYRSSKAAIFASLSVKVSDNSTAYDILSAYQNLARAAKFTRCHYLDLALEKRWVEEANDMERLSMPWTTIVQPEM